MNPPGDIGQLDRRVQLQTRASGQDAMGGPSGAWFTSATVWARIEETLGRETRTDGETAATRPLTVWIRHSSDVAAIDEGDRVLHGARVLEIKARALHGRDLWIAFDCEERRAAG